MKVLKTIGDVALIFLAIFSCVIMIGYAFFSIFVDQTTIGVNNVADQIAIDVKSSDELTSEEKDAYEERWFMEANYYSNDLNNGIKLQELNFNYFMSPKLLEADYRATGIQYVGDYSANKVFSEFAETGKLPYVYETTNGISWTGYSTTLSANGTIGTKLSRDTEFIIKIDNRPFTIQLTGGYTTGWWIFAQTTDYQYGDLFELVFDAIESNSAGYGDYYITLDLSYFFSIKEMSEDGKFLADNVTDIIKNYAVLKFHYDKNGAINSNQSLFGRIENNSVYDSADTEFWTSRTVYTLTEENLEYRYSESYEGYLVSLSNDMKNMFDKMPAVKLVIKIDLFSDFIQDNGYNVIGFDYNAFSGFDIDTLTVYSSPKTIYVMQDAFKDATLKTLKYSTGVTFSGEFGIEYEGVVL